MRKILAVVMAMVIAMTGACAAAAKASPSKSGPIKNKAAMIKKK